MRAWSLIRSQPVYRHEAFVSGLQAAGYEYVSGGPSKVRQGDVLCCWNRYGSVHEQATEFERQGGMVLVAENGYVGSGGISPHSQEQRETFALAIGGHNGSGRWNIGGPERWEALGIELKPWRTRGEHILICPNRSFGRPDMIMPREWAQDVEKRLRNVSDRPIRVRPHPGNGQPKKPLEDDLDGAFLVVIWSSSVGVHALIEGVPVYREAPHWICGDATEIGIPINQPSEITCKLMDERRLRTMQSLAWAQWNISEIASGQAFRHLCSIS